MDCAKGCRSVGWNGDQYECLRCSSFQSQKCIGPDDDDCFVISGSSPFSPGKVKTVLPRVVGRRFGVGPLARSEWGRALIYPTTIKFAVCSSDGGSRCQTGRDGNNRAGISP